MFYCSSFELDENHKLCILKTLPCKTNDPVDGNTNFIYNYYIYIYIYWISVLHCTVILRLKVIEAATRGVL